MRSTEDVPRAIDVTFTENELIVHLVDGRTFVVALTFYPRLLNATQEQRRECRLIGNGEYIQWPQIDEDLTVAGLLRAAWL